MRLEVINDDEYGTCEAVPQNIYKIHVSSSFSVQTFKTQALTISATTLHDMTAQLMPVLACTDKQVQKLQRAISTASCIMLIWGAKEVQMQQCP